jgi:hypothetical protein
MRRTDILLGDILLGDILLGVILLGGIEAPSLRATAGHLARISRSVAELGAADAPASGRERDEPDVARRQAAANRAEV